MSSLIAFSVVAAVLGGLQDPPKATFTHPDTGLTFDYPATWTSRKVRTGWEFSVPVADGKSAKISILGLVYSGEIEIWQIGQADAAKQDKRTVVRQWQEDILNCPLLLTQTSWKQGETEMMGESGIIYSQTPRKFVYRVTAEKEQFEAAVGSFRTALQSMRTDDGSTLRPFDPNSKPTEAEKNALRSAPVRSVWAGKTQKAPKVERSKNQVEGTAAGRKTLLFFPDKWTVEAKGGDKFVFRHASVTGDVTVETLSTLDSPAPGRQMLQYAGESLKRFIDVSRREEPMAFQSRAGMIVSWISREGKTEAGPLLTLDAVGVNTLNEFFTVRWSSTDVKRARKERDVILELVQRLSVELAP